MNQRISRSLLPVTLLLTLILCAAQLFAQQQEDRSPSQSMPTAQQPDQQSPSQPASPSAQQPTQPPAAQSPSPAPSTDPKAEASDQGKDAGGQVFSGTITKMGDKFVLQDSATGTKYEIDRQDLAKNYEGKQVRIKGTLDPDGKTIHVK